MKISKKTQYGLRAMIFLASKENEFHSLREISIKEGIPFNYLEKICSQLEKNKLLDSRKGVNGGYKISMSPKKIKVGSVMRALEEKISLVDCIDSSCFCERKKNCLTIKAWLKLQCSIEKTIDSISLYDLLKND